MLFGRYREFLLEKRDALRKKVTATGSGSIIDSVDNAITDEFRTLVQELDRMEREVLEIAGSTVRDARER